MLAAGDVTGAAVVLGGRHTVAGTVVQIKYAAADTGEQGRIGLIPATSMRLGDWATPVTRGGSSRARSAPTRSSAEGSGRSSRT